MNKWDIPRSAVAVDLTVLTVRDRSLQVLVVTRANPPFQDRIALPGGFLEDGEDLDQAAHRELAEETGLNGADLAIRQLRSYGAPDRDPRGRVVSVNYVALMPDLPLPVAGGDAKAAHWVPVQDVLSDPDKLAFDHHRLLIDAVDYARSQLSATTLATKFCPPEFTIAQLREVYEIVWDVELDPSNFHRKVTGSRGFLIPTGTRAEGTGGRPAKLYRAGTGIRLHPALLRDSVTDEPHDTATSSRRAGKAPNRR
ncbi:NUDIX domain-containing protein [Amycolatopsis sp. WQ 127309]|uniref:NUDIX hydrolase n=1 Tax=Amycolatopsis sp. WQ 127309 TaxID=2932773 RepID=UPI001FF37B28|nr:NUDIX domain-containing protein [Amycolatopsis sp. WQ 127309]UOZ05685.1 NUDIX hydrolase [Amycolatopsis sp. WQ 127309]